MLETAQNSTVPDNPTVIQITRVSGQSLFRLKSWLPDYTTDGKPIMLVGLELPSQTGEIHSGPIRVLCVGPGEWLLVVRDHQGLILPDHIGADLAKHCLAILDATDGTAILEVRGSAARELLSKGCGLDLHLRSFPAGRCARTRFAQIPVVVECVDGPPRFKLYVTRSYHHFLHAWLIDASAEFEIP